MLHVLAEDSNRCCKRLFNLAVVKGDLEAMETWTCKTCGCEYRAPLAGPLRDWQYVCGVLVFRN